VLAGGDIEPEPLKPLLLRDIVVLGDFERDVIERRVLAAQPSEARIVRPVEEPEALRLPLVAFSDAEEGAGGGPSKRLINSSPTTSS
jgi:hypothetical protein